jgi:glycosyltransferase involved in cell wall biosynthesis
MPALKTCFIGPFAPPYNGDGIKNSILKEGFVWLGKESIDYYDTILRGRNLIAFATELLRVLFKNRQIMLSLNKNGRYLLLPFIWVASLCGKRALLFVVGGAFDQQLQRLPKFVRRMYVTFLNGLDFVFVESKSMQEALVRFGIRNSCVLYNPRRDSGTRWRLSSENRNRIVFLSRVTPTKGITYLMDAVEGLNERGEPLQLDVYGPIDPAFKNDFLRRVGGRTFFSYKGIVDPGDVHAVLSRYHAFVLPTFHDGEGLPGALVEAGLVGIPSIVTDFNAIGEYVEDGVSAFLVRPRDAGDLACRISAVVRDDQLAKALSMGIQSAVHPFRLETVMSQVHDFLRERNWNL